jgi:hypothetical protein
MERNLARIQRSVRDYCYSYPFIYSHVQKLIGSSLVKFGRAHCKIATLQEAYTVTFKDTFVTSLQQFEDSIKEYEHLKKKLESRRYKLLFNFPRVTSLTEF